MTGTPLTAAGRSAMATLPIEGRSSAGDGFSSVPLDEPVGNAQVADDVEEGPASLVKAVTKSFPKEESSSNQDKLKWFVLVFLTFQNSSASILMRLTRSEAGAVANPQTFVVAQEAVKGLVCIVLLLKEGSLSTVFADRTEALKTAVPAICYLIQNNLQYVAVGYLDASTYAVLYQLKILTTALLSVVILGRELVCIQWVSLAVLTAGVSAVVISQMSKASNGDLIEDKSKPVDSILPGLAAVLVACLMSGLAGVYFEKLLKGSSISLWARNLQLAIYSIIIGVVGLFAEHPDFSMSTDFFHGYTTSVWLSILNNAFGGLLVAVVIKYADVILKNFSASLSIVLTAVVSAVFLGATINSFFLLGAAMVIYSMFLYSKLNPLDMLKKFVPAENGFIDLKEIKSPHPEKS